MTVTKQNDDKDSVLNFYRDIIALRKNSPALRHGDIEFLDSTPELLLIKRTSESETRICAFNLTDSPLALSLASGFSADVVVGEPANGRTLPAYSGVISKPL